MNMRLLLAALAPPTPAAWFEFKFSEPPPTCPEGATWCENCKFDAGTCDESLSCQAMQHYQQLKADWRTRLAKAHDAQWRLAWADNLIKQHASDTTFPLP